MRVDNIEKVRLKVTLKAGPKEFAPGVYGPRIDPIILEEVRLETGTAEVLKSKGPSAPVIFAPVFKDKVVRTGASFVMTSNMELDEESGTPPISEEEAGAPKKPVLRVRKKK